MISLLAKYDGHQKITWLFVQALKLLISVAIATSLFIWVIAYIAEYTDLVVAVGGFNIIGVTTLIVRGCFKIFKQVLPIWLLIAISLVTVSFAICTVYYNSKVNTDGQGQNNLQEVLSGMNPREAFEYHENLPYEELCAYELRKKGGEFVDQDGDSFAPDCGDEFDNDPSYTPRALKQKFSITDYEPNQNLGAVLAKQRKFSAPVPHLGQDPIKDLRLYITADFLGPEDGEGRYYNQQCKIAYEKRSKVVCFLTEEISEWRVNFGSGSVAERKMMWNLKYVTELDNYGYVTEEWIPFQASFR